MWESPEPSRKSPREEQTYKERKKAGTPASRKQVKEAAKGKEMPFHDGNGDDDGGVGRNNSYDSSLENFNYALDILLCPSYQPYEEGFFP